MSPRPCRVALHSTMNLQALGLNYSIIGTIDRLKAAAADYVVASHHVTLALGQIVTRHLRTPSRHPHYPSYLLPQPCSTPLLCCNNIEINFANAKE